MKVQFLTAFMAISAIVCSCSNNDGSEEKSKDNSITAFIDSELATKTVIGPGVPSGSSQQGYIVSWHAGELIDVARINKDGTQKFCRYYNDSSQSSGSQQASFVALPGEEDIFKDSEDAQFIAFFGLEVGENYIGLPNDGTQFETAGANTIVDHLPMIGILTDKAARKFKFHNVCAVLRINPGKEFYSQVKVTALTSGVYLSGAVDHEAIFNNPAVIQPIVIDPTKGRVETNMTICLDPEQTIAYIPVPECSTALQIELFKKAYGTADVTKTNHTVNTLQSGYIYEINL